VAVVGGEVANTWSLLLRDNWDGDGRDVSDGGPSRWW
jgi:hypothetical protein